MDENVFGCFAPQIDIALRLNNKRQVMPFFKRIIGLPVLYLLLSQFRVGMSLAARRSKLLFSLAQPICLRGLAVFSNLRSSAAESSCPASEPRCFPSHRPPVRMTAAVSPAMAPTQDISGPKWNLEYPSLDDASVTADLASADEHMSAMESTGKHLSSLVANAKELEEGDGLVEKLADMHKRYYKTVILLRNVGTFASCLSSVDGTDADAKKMSARIQTLFARCRAAYEPASLILDLCPEALFRKFLAVDEETATAEFVLRHSRRMADHRLSLAEENMITGLQVTGHSAWGTMYTDLSSVIPVNMRQPDGTVKAMGIATAEAMRDSPDEETRRSSWEAIREAWLPHQETCAAALNAITGWRLDLYSRRKFDSPLTSSLHMNRMSQATLNALLAALDSSSEVGRSALRIQAKALGKKALEPWDLFAPAPVSGTGVGRIYSFDEGIELIANAVSAVDEEAGAFVHMMKEKRWIEASRGDKKRPGA